MKGGDVNLSDWHTNAHVQLTQANKERRTPEVNLHVSREAESVRLHEAKLYVT